MPGSQSTPSAALPTSLGDNKTIKFEIKTGNSRWVCTLQDRAAYERQKASRTTSTTSTSTTSTTSTSTDSSSESSSSSVRSS
ncbi:uncharacterized protein CPUR_01588 [Claviceps purpurea 20.1]|uniref:Uncharacterized protein n=1 Tax=Claviceps purpurea (strain 20.1) TaxID=1111077 RepID=M1WB85_CLAP2|nr:hypothetical protein E4U51_005879 [Claviceps purpurea]CCE28114.1 uncharacterized protein CPUR_01588 [Claviceps purpurea 20.1]KAG6180929.1 hypothetical protein E4U36_004424 [Claviceps purpurea]KAG6188139.1 hypothetical protein E4U27_007498 [Claviceps purpurea]KAG6223796.1 hypothetical protein E4U26_004291 [Claviceps purpurea]